MQAYNNLAGTSVTVHLQAREFVCVLAHTNIHPFPLTTTLQIHFRNFMGNVKENHKILKMNAHTSAS
jgi:hypothetical protein